MAKKVRKIFAKYYVGSAASLDNTTEEGKNQLLEDAKIIAKDALKRRVTSNDIMVVRNYIVRDLIEKKGPKSPTSKRSRSKDVSDSEDSDRDIYSGPL